MHSVLTVDLSAIPAEISVSSIEGNVVAVTQAATVDLGEFTSAHILKGFLKPDSTGDTQGTIRSEGAANSLVSTSSELSIAADRLKECLARLEPSWTSSVVVAPPIDFIALNLSLPFGDAKNLNKIIDLEIQDVVPFEIDEFLVQHRTLSGMAKLPGGPDVNGGRSHDVHVGIIPREVIRNVIELTHRCELEPVVVASPSSAIAGVFQIAPDYFKENSAVISLQQDLCCVAVRVDGEVRAERVLQRSREQPAEDEARSLFSDLRLTLSSIERRYGTRVDHVYVLGNSSRINQLQQALARPIETFTLADVVRCDTSVSRAGPLAAIFAREEDVGSVLTNFRVREFAYSPRFSELLVALRSAGTYVSIALVMAFVALGSYFGATQYKLRQEEISIVQQIGQIIPDFVPPTDGDIISAIRTRETQLSDELGTLGSPSRNTPLDAFASISKDLPNDIPNLQVQSMKIRTGNASFEGVAPDLSAVEKVENALQSNKTAYKQVKKTVGAADPRRGYRFTIDILLNE